MRSPIITASLPRRGQQNARWASAVFLAMLLSGCKSFTLLEVNIHQAPKGGPSSSDRVGAPDVDVPDNLEFVIPSEVIQP